MKHLILLCLLVTSMFTAQTVKMVTPKIKTIGGATVTVSIPQGQVFDLDKKIPKTREEIVTNSSMTTNSAIYKSSPYEVYATKKGRLFIVVPTKDGLGYTRKYINTTNK